MAKIANGRLGLLAIVLSALVSCSPASSASGKADWERVAVGHEFRPCKDCPVFVRIPDMPGSSRKIVFVAKYELTWRNYIASVEAGSCRMARAETRGIGIVEPKRDFAAEARNAAAYKIDWPVTTLDLTEFECYLNWLQDKTKLRVSLPTADEWERIARAGQEGVKYPWGNEPLATREALPGGVSTWDMPYLDEIHELAKRSIEIYGVKVGSYPPNPWGIHDLMGNVIEVVSSAPPTKSTGLDLVFGPRERNGYSLDPGYSLAMLKGVSKYHDDWVEEGISRVRYTLVLPDGRFGADVAIRIVLAEVN